LIRDLLISLSLNRINESPDSGDVTWVSNNIDVMFDPLISLPSLRVPYVKNLNNNALHALRQKQLNLITSLAQASLDKKHTLKRNKIFNSAISESYKNIILCYLRDTYRIIMVDRLVRRIPTYELTRYLLIKNRQIKSNRDKSIINKMTNDFKMNDVASIYSSLGRNRRELLQSNVIADTLEYFFASKNKFSAYSSKVRNQHIKYQALMGVNPQVSETSLSVVNDYLSAVYSHRGYKNSNNLTVNGNLPFTLYRIPNTKNLGINLVDTLTVFGSRNSLDNIQTSYSTRTKLIKSELGDFYLPLKRNESAVQSFIAFPVDIISDENREVPNDVLVEFNTQTVFNRASGLNT
jgi:hypothetical protein